MSTQRRKGFRAIAVFLTFAMAQVYIQLSFAEPTSSSGASALPQQFIARLSTSGGPITVNGLSASTGASLVTGARIVTPAATSATVDLGPLGSLSISPDSDVRLDFDENNKTIKVTVFRGCIGITANRGTHSQVDTEQQEKAAERDRAAGGVISGCVGPTGFIEGAGAGGAVGAGVGGGTGAGLSTAAVATIVTSLVAVPVVLYFALRDRDDRPNPSPSTP